MSSLVRGITHAEQGCLEGQQMSGLVALLMPPDTHTCGGKKEEEAELQRKKNTPSFAKFC